MFDCPVRTNGTLMVSSEKGIEDIDISDRGKSPYPVVEVGKIK